MVRKVLQQTCNVGFEAPRNSLEMPVETSYYAVGDNIPFSYEVRHEWPQAAYTKEVPIKKLIKEEISKRPEPRRNTSNVVARLMGMDTLPFDEKTISNQPQINSENHIYKEHNKKGIGSRGGHYKSYTLGNTEFEDFHHNNDIDFLGSQIHNKSKKPKPREHPQEEELQKFKKEFEAWQAARFRECSKVADLDTVPDQLLAQEILNKEKATLYANSGRCSISEKPRELNGLATKGTIQHERGAFKQQIYSISERSLSGDFDQICAPTKIVVLRPGPERFNDNDDSRASSSGISEERGGLEDFLEEVKERLKCELQGKIKRESIVRGGGIETRYSEKVSDPKQIAQRIAKQVRESVSRDLDMNLLRSASTRSYRSEIDQYNEPSSPEYMNRGTRRLLPERLRNVLKEEINQKISKFSNGFSSVSLVREEREIQEQEETHMRTNNTRQRDLHPRSLVRSLSAPISGASFGKLLLEDRHVLTGAHIRRKHESSEKVVEDLKKRKKEKSKFRERVSSFKYSFMLKGRLFGRKIQSLEQPQNNDYANLRDIRTGPTVMMNQAERHENCTEVPPSPASVCNGIDEEFWMSSEHLSSTSMSDLSPLEDTTQIFREISSNLRELRRKLKEFDGVGNKEIETEEQTLLAEMKLDDDAQAYIRDLIVASGLHRGSSDKVLSIWDPLSKLISNQIFEQVEETYDNKVKENKEPIKKKLNHKILYGLLNEALSVVLGPPMTVSKFRKEALGPTRPLHGKKLLDCVWEIVSSHLYPQGENSFFTLNDMVERDLGSIPWSGLIPDEIYALEREIESHITGNLIEELVKDIDSL